MLGSNTDTIPILKNIYTKMMERPLFDDIREHDLPEFARKKRNELSELSKKYQCSLILNPVHPEYSCGTVIDGVCHSQDHPDVHKMINGSYCAFM
jgi:hypothetical protein